MALLVDAIRASAPPPRWRLPRESRLRRLLAVMALLSIQPEKRK